MKRSERRKLEKEIQLLGMEVIKLDSEQDARITAWVKEQYELAMEEQEEKAAEKRGIGIGRRILLVSAAAMLLMVLSFAYTVFTPNAVSNAKGFVQRATIWVNDAFHLGLKVEVPPKDFKQGQTNDTIYYSLEEAAANLPYPLVYFQDPNAELKSITLQQTYPFPEIVLSYQYETAQCDIMLVSLGENYIGNLESIDGEIIPWQHGEMACWSINEHNHARAYYLGMEIHITDSGNMPYSVFQRLCRSLTEFTEPECYLSLLSCVHSNSYSMRGVG